MGVRAIRLRNFMPFEDTGWLELRPITLLFGRNSSGKSAILRALRLLKQSLAEGTPEAPLAFLSEYGVDLGSFETMVNQRPMEAAELAARITRPAQRAVTFGFRCDITDYVSLLDGALPRGETLTRPSASGGEMDCWLDLHVSFGWDAVARQVKLVGMRLNYTTLDQAVRQDYTVLQAGLSIVDDIEGGSAGDAQWAWSTEWEFWSDVVYGHEQDGNSGLWQTVVVRPTGGWLPELRYQGDWDGVKATPTGRDFTLVSSVLATARESIRGFLSTFDHSGPVRPAPERVYTLNRLALEHLDQQGLRGWGRFLRGRVNDRDRAAIDVWLQRLNLGEGVEVTVTPGPQQTSLSEVHIRRTEGGRANLMDVGYGTGQVLPVIVQSVVAADDERAPTDSRSLLAIEQPELHLHPRAQLALTDVFVDRVYDVVVGRDAEDQETVERRPTRVRFLLETHSEYLLLRLRRRLAEALRGSTNTSHEPSEYLSHQDLIVYFVGPGQRSSQVTEVQISELGEFQNRPQGFDDFFVDDLLEAREWARVLAGPGSTSRG